MRSADERSAKRITRVLHVAPGKENWIPISRRGNGQQGKSLGILGKPDVCSALPSPSRQFLIPYISSTRRWTRLRNFLIATKAVQRKRSVVRFLPFGCIGHFTLLQQLFSPGISRYRLPCGNVAEHTAGAQIKRNRCVQFARAAHFQPDVAASRAAIAQRVHRLINISPWPWYQRPNCSHFFRSFD